MARNFSVIKTNVGNNVQDTSTGFSVILGNYINRRYFQVLRAINWNYINEDYTISVTAGTQDYTLPTDFSKIVYCVDTTNGREIDGTTIGKIAQAYPNNLTTSGTIRRYATFSKDDGSQVIRFHYNPDTDRTVALPYIVKPSELSADGDQPVLNLEDILEVGATADALRYKRQYAKAKDYEAQFRIHLDDYIWEQANDPNRITQFTPTTYNRNDLV